MSYTYDIRRENNGRRRKWLLFAGVLLLVAVAGIGWLRLGGVTIFKAAKVDDNLSDKLDTSAGQATHAKPTTLIGNSLLLARGLGFAPYAFVPYANVSMADFAAATGTKNFFAAFIQSSGTGCTPYWDGSSSLGLDSARAAAILADITEVRAKAGDGDVAVSFGGQSGTDLADSCSGASQLQTAYQSVVTKYNLTTINFDIESAAETNAAGLTRQVQAASGLLAANKGLKITLTLPVEATGLDADALAVLKRFHDAKVPLASVNIMALDFGGAAGAGGQAAKITSAVQATASQIKQLYSGVTDAEAWRALGIVVMVGRNDTPETFQLADAKTIHDFAVQHGVGTLSMWSANRDQACPGNVSGAAAGNASKASGTSSGISQAKYQLTAALKL